MSMNRGFSFRLGGRVIQSDGVTCLYRAVDAEAMAMRCLMLTKDGRFAYLDRVIGGKGMPAAEEWSGDRARRFLIDHGESELVEEFPAIFRKRPLVATAGVRAVSTTPKGRPAEPYLFPLH